METGKLDPRLILGIVQSLYRLFRVGTFHALDNEAIGLAIGSTLAALRRLDQFESEGITLIFAEDTAIVNGQLLRAPPEIYESAMDFARFLEKVGVNSITISKTVSEDCLRRLLALFVDDEDPVGYLDEERRLSKSIRLRLINPNLLLGLEDERLSQLERVLLTYALSVLVIRRLFSSIETGSYDLAGYFKRMARQLAMVNYADRPVVFDVIIARHLQPDVAKLAVNSAILSVAMTRRFTEHEATLSRLCMAALLLDVGRHRPAAVAAQGPAPQLPLSTALVHMAMGSLRGDSIDRTIITYEAQSLLDGVPPQSIYSDDTLPAVDAYIIATARRFVELVTRRTGDQQLTTDAAIEHLHHSAPDDVAHYCVDLLTDAIGLIPRGSCVELNSGYRGVVLHAGPIPTDYENPTVRLVEDERGNRIEPTVVALHEDTPQAQQHKPVMRVINRPSALLSVVQREVAGPLFDWIATRKESEARVRQWLDLENRFREAAGIEEVRAETSGIHKTLPEGSAVADARHLAMGWTGSESGAHEDVSEASTRRLKKSPAAVEFERRSGAHPVVAADFADVGTGLKRTLSPSTGSGLSNPIQATAPESAVNRRVVTGAGQHGSGSRRVIPASEETTGNRRVVGSASDSQATARHPQRLAGSGVHRTIRGATDSAAVPVVARTADAETINPDEFGSEANSSVRFVGSGVYRRSTKTTDTREILPSDGSAAAGDSLGADHDASGDRKSIREHLAEVRARQASTAESGAVHSVGGPDDASSARPAVETPMAGTGILKRTGSRKAVRSGSHSTASRATPATRPSTPPSHPFLEAPVPNPDEFDREHAETPIRRDDSTE